MMSFRGQATWARMTSPGGKLTVLAYLPTKKVNKTEELAQGILKGEVSLYC
jgi:hypothetical protein